MVRVDWANTSVFGFDGPLWGGGVCCACSHHFHLAVRLPLPESVGPSYFRKAVRAR